MQELLKWEKEFFSANRVWKKKITFSTMPVPLAPYPTTPPALYTHAPNGTLLTYSCYLSHHSLHGVEMIEHCFFRLIENVQCSILLPWGDGGRGKLFWRPSPLDRFTDKSWKYQIYQEGKRTENVEILDVFCYDKIRLDMRYVLIR